MIRFCFTVCIILLVCGDLFAQVSWETVYPVPDANEKSAVASPSAGQFIIVGAEGRILVASMLKAIQQVCTSITSPGIARA